MRPPFLLSYGVSAAKIVPDFAEDDIATGASVSVKTNQDLTTVASLADNALELRDPPRGFEVCRTSAQILLLHLGDRLAPLFRT